MTAAWTTVVPVNVERGEQVPCGSEGAAAWLPRVHTGRVKDAPGEPLGHCGQGGAVLTDGDVLKAGQARGAGAAVLPVSDLPGAFTSWAAIKGIAHRGAAVIEMDPITI